MELSGKILGRVRLFKKAVQSDGVSAVTSAVDALTGGLPVASVTQNLAKQFSSSRDALFVRKVQAVIEEISVLEPVLMLSLIHI